MVKYTINVIFEVEDFLFYSEIVDFENKASKVKKFSGNLINTEGEKIPYRQVYDFFLLHYRGHLCT